MQVALGASETVKEASSDTLVVGVNRNLGKQQQSQEGKLQQALT